MEQHRTMARPGRSNSYLYMELIPTSPVAFFAPCRTCLVERAGVLLIWQYEPQVYTPPTMLNKPNTDEIKFNAPPSVHREECAKTIGAYKVPHSAKEQQEQCPKGSRVRNLFGWVNIMVVTLP